MSVYSADNSSEDSEGKDSSFEIPNESSEESEKEKNIEYTSNNNNIQKIKFKNPKKQINNFDEFEKKQKKMTEFQKKQKNLIKSNVSLWQNFYRIIFKQHKENYIPLNEILLRCKLLSKIDKIEKDTVRSKSENKDFNNKPLTNLNEFVNYFCDKKFQTFCLLKKKNNKDGSINNIINMRKNSKKENFVVEKENRNLLKLYGIKTPVDTINKIIKEDRKNNYKRKNFDSLFSNKKIYEQEIDNFLKMNKEDPDSNKIFDEYLDLKSNDFFLNDNIGVDLIETYEHKLEEQKKLGAHLNYFYDKVMRKIDPLKKLDEFNI